MLAAAGFPDIGHVHHAHVTTFTTKDDWWAWSWSHGMRAIWERVPAAAVEDARSAAYEAIDGIRDPDGAITRPTDPPGDDRAHLNDRRTTLARSLA